MRIEPADHLSKFLPYFGRESIDLAKPVDINGHGAIYIMYKPVGCCPRFPPWPLLLRAAPPYTTPCPVINSDLPLSSPNTNKHKQK